MLILILLAGTAAHYAPILFVHGDRPVKSDVIVLFEGSPDREKEAHLLLGDGYARALIIPLVQFPQYFRSKAQNKGSKTYPSFYESTHVEVLLAKRVMKQNGFKSAIFVSSPYHLRRIKLITDKIFDQGSSKIVFVPTSFETSGQGLFKRTISYWSNSVNEYIKILWFLIYSWFATY